MIKKSIYMSLLISAFLIGCSPYGNLTKMEFNDLQYPFDVHYVTLDDGRKIAYVDEGNFDETIIFVHGLGSYLPAWKKNVEALSKKYRTIALDLPGYGKSSKEPHTGTPEFYSDVIAELMDKLDIENANIAGHSMGGQAAMAMALKYPAKVKRLILAAPAGIEEFNEGQKEWFREVMTVNAVMLTPVQQIRANVAANFFNMPSDAEFMVTDRIALRGADQFDNYCYTVVQSVNGMVDQPVAHLLKRITQPTLILFGENDNLIPNPYLNPGFTSEIGKKGRDLIPNSELVMIPDCGHFLQFEKPGEFNKAVEYFLN
ncbi:MAG: alpha/beta hydrolase [Melioribacteraceae bacterium]|nr:alpha/beta hydrolase [Melioribacteraceae bacterium]MCF8354511.1 alpha/beta hydrolase [Melioribacteraceae bacterium]MCF8394280.1 alpha/beta hydrolase [Melioribacteraceae bacterium]MCF8418180.1 alpha/beta hydrolase [Melioribacteraceae bacterium]